MAVADRQRSNRLGNKRSFVVAGHIAIDFEVGIAGNTSNKSDHRIGPAFDSNNLEFGIVV